MDYPRIAAGIVGLACRAPAGLRVVRTVQRSPARRVLQAALKYRRPFATLHEAQAAVAAHAGGGHEDTANTDWHAGLQETIRPSDYAALFHLQAILPGLRRVFDAGGNVGNLYYGYARYLTLPAGLVWQVQDLPATIARGEQLARERGAASLRFTTQWADGSGADLLIAAGSLHYFSQPLHQMVATLAHPPASILINRTPLTDGPPVATVQDGGGFRVACMLYNRGALIAGFDRIGYECVDTWRAPELSLHIPGYPEHSAPHYTGMFLRRRMGA